MNYRNTKRYLVSSTKTKDQVKGGLLLDVVVAEGASIFELLPGEDQTLLVGGDPLLVLDLGLHVVDRIRGLDVEGDGLPGEGLDEYLRGPRTYGTNDWVRAHDSLKLLRSSQLKQQCAPAPTPSIPLPIIFVRFQKSCRDGG